jgi:peptide/nickel transport system ATP-binding protein
LSAVPIADPEVTKREIVLEGNLPSAMKPPKGCPFCTRCHRRIGDICDNEPPPEQTVDDQHVIKCHIPLEELRQVLPVITVPDESERIHVKQW